MEPYYVLMRLPGEERLEFMLMLPMTPQGRDNLIAWVAARSDFPDYGGMVTFKLPKERLIYGPMQVEALIDQNTEISRQLALWDQRGSRVLRGNLLVIPIDHSLLYVEPVYLVAEQNDLPQLKRMIVAHGGRVAMEPTLEAALAALFGAPEKGPQASETAQSPAVLGDIRARLADAESGAGARRLGRLRGSDGRTETGCGARRRHECGRPQGGRVAVVGVIPSHTIYIPTHHDEIKKRQHD